MFNISDIYTEKPNIFNSKLQEAVYQALDELEISYQRVDTEEVITMEECVLIENKLDMKMVKTLFLSNRQKTQFYLLITRGDKPFNSKDFSKALDISRVSFAPKDLFEEMLQTKIGAATIYSLLIDHENQIQLVVDHDVLLETYYGCSDGTTTGYMKVKTDDIFQKFLPTTNHQLKVVYL